MLNQSMSKSSFRCNIRVSTKNGAELTKSGPAPRVIYEGGSSASISVVGFVREVVILKSQIKTILDRFIDDAKLTIVSANGDTVMLSAALTPQLKHLVTTVTGKTYAQSGETKDESSKRSIVPSDHNKRSRFAEVYKENITMALKPAESVPPADFCSTNLADLPDSILVSIFEFSGFSHVSGILRRFGEIGGVCKGFSNLVRSLRGGVFINGKDLPLGASFLIKAFHKHALTGNCKFLLLPECPITREDAVRLVSLAPIKIYENVKSLSLRGCVKITEKGVVEILKKFQFIEYLDLLDVPGLTSDCLNKYRNPNLKTLFIGSLFNSRIQSKIDNLRTIFEMRQLQYLTVTGCDLITNLPKSSIQLIHLDISKSSLSSTIDLLQFKNSLRSLRLANVTSLTPIALTTGLELPNLEICDLTGTSANNETLQKLVLSSPLIRRLKVSGCRGVHNSGVAAVLSGFEHLELFDISSNFQVNEIFTQNLSIRAKTKFKLLGVFATNLVPIFLNDLNDFFLTETGNPNVVYHKNSAEVITYSSDLLPPTSLESSIKLKGL